MGLFSRLATHPVYNTRAVALRTGVPADTFRAWERRYGLPTPARSEGNQRLYSDRDIATIAWLRDQTRAGMTISQAVDLFRSRDALSPDEQAATNGSTATPLVAIEAITETPTLSRFTNAIVEALVAYDSRTASLVLEEVLALVPVEDVCLKVLQPALYEIGDRWQGGEILISVEHFATSFAVRKLGTLFSLSRPEHGRGPIVATCLEGELHEAGLLMTCLFLSRRGLRVIYLGPNLPMDDLIATIQDIRPPLVLLSASTAEGAMHLAHASRAIKQACVNLGAAAHVPEIGYGGRIYRDVPSLRNHVDGVYCSRDANEAVAAIAEILDRAESQESPLAVGT